jgi:hypothetical protein
MGFGAFHPRQTHQRWEMRLTSVLGAPNGLAISSFLRSGDVFRLLVCAVTVQGWTDA